MAGLLLTVRRHYSHRPGMAVSHPTTQQQARPSRLATNQTECNHHNISNHTSHRPPTGPTTKDQEAMPASKSETPITRTTTDQSHRPHISSTSRRRLINSTVAYSSLQPLSTASNHSSNSSTEGRICPLVGSHLRPRQDPRRVRTTALCKQVNIRQGQAGTRVIRGGQLGSRRVVEVILGLG